MGGGLDAGAAGSAEQVMERGWKEQELELKLTDQQRKLEGVDAWAGVKLMRHASIVTCFITC